MFFVARVWLAIYVATLALALLIRWWIPVVLVGTPRVYGCWHMVMCGLLQHGGLADNLTDHRLNSRTVLMNPVSSFIYWNMNYHIEHHMFQMVPFHALPKLHALIKHDLPAPSPSILAGYREMIPPSSASSATRTISLSASCRRAPSLTARNCTRRPGQPDGDVA